VTGAKKRSKGLVERTKKRMKKKDESSGRKNPIAVRPINVHITTPEI
jgi:hypothetical protein